MQESAKRLLDAARDAEMNSDKMQCQSMAYGAYPPVMMASGRAVQSPSQTTCSQFGGQLHCTTTPGVSTPAPQIDINSIDRGNAINSCMRGKGWSWKSQ